MKLKRFLAMGMSAVMIMAVAAGCGGSDSGSSSTAASSSAASSGASGEKLTFGWSVYTRDQTFFQQLEKGVVDKATELGIEIKTHDQKNDSNEMVTGCTNLINSGVDALIVCPCKPEAMGNIVTLAHQKDIPVIITDIGDGDSDKDAIIISDMKAGGQMAGVYTAELLKEKSITSGEVAIIKCEESAVYAQRRNEGYKEEIEKAGFTVAKELVANSKQEEGYTVMKDILASNPDIVAVFAANDPMAAGAASALQEAGKTDVIVTGFNGDDIALEYIADGKMMGTVAQDVLGIGAKGVELAKLAVEGKDIPYDNADKKEVYVPVSFIGKDGKEVEVEISK